MSSSRSIPQHSKTATETSLARIRVAEARIRVAEARIRVAEAGLCLATKGAGTATLQSRRSYRLFDAERLRTTNVNKYHRRSVHIIK